MTSSAIGRSAILVLPTAVAGQHGPVAAWLSTAGWAAAVRRVVGESWIVSPQGMIDVDDARACASRAALAPPERASSMRRHTPVPAKVAVKDAREWWRARRFTIDPAGPWQRSEVSFVWQRHELFHTAGLALARRLGVPSVLFVPATLVAQSTQWGVRRPGWVRLVEHLGDARPLVTADLVAAGTDAVADEAIRLGVDAARVVVTPTGVDLDAFRERPNGSALRTSLALDGRFVVGWVGSFRRFHALDQAVDAVAQIPDATLLLVGDGPERARIEEMARSAGVQVVATGTVPHDSIPGLIAAMDAALVLAAPGRSFHYSPLKLAEYLAAGVAVVAPRIGSIPERLTDGVDALLYEPGDPRDLAACLERLREDPAARRRIADAGRAAAFARWSWDRSVELVVQAVAGLGPARG